MHFGIYRNAPKIIEALSVDGSCGQHIESSMADHPSSGALLSALFIVLFTLLLASLLQTDRFILRIYRENLGLTIREICNCS